MMNDIMANRKSAQNLATPAGEPQASKIEEIPQHTPKVIEDAEEVNCNSITNWIGKKVGKKRIKSTISKCDETESKCAENGSNKSIKRYDEEGNEFAQLVGSTVGREHIGERCKESDKNLRNWAIVLPDNEGPDERGKLKKVIEKVNNVVEMLLPGQKIKWVATMSAITQGGVWSDETPIIQIVMSKLGHHPVVLAKLCELTNQGNDEPKAKLVVLERFYTWMRDTYQDVKHQGSVETPIKVQTRKVNGENAEINVATANNDRPMMIGKVGESSREQAQTGELKYDLTISELDKLGKRIIPLTAGNEIGWAIITRDLTENLTLKNKKVILEIMLKKLGQHGDASAQAVVLLVQTAREPDEYSDPLERFHEWLLRKYQLTIRQQMAKFRLLLQNMPWSWESNPADRLREIMHEVHLTWGEAAQINAFQEELKAIIGSKMEADIYLKLCEKPVKEWYNEMTKLWMTLRVKEMTEKDGNKTQAFGKRMQKLDETAPSVNTSFDARDNGDAKICFKCGLKGHIAHNCKTKTNNLKRRGLEKGAISTKRVKTE